MKIIQKKITDIREYENNPRKNDAAVQYVAERIKNFGWQQPIVIDKDGVIVAGHTRYKAAQSLGLDKVPCVCASELNEDQVRAYRLIDNKTAEFSEWDMTKLEEELQSVNFPFEDFGFENIDFQPSNDEIPRLDEIEKEPIVCPHCGKEIMVTMTEKRRIQ